MLCALGFIFIKKVAFYVFVNKKDFSANQKCGLAIIFFLTFRGFAEISFAVFSIDHLFFIAGLFLFFQNHDEPKNAKISE